MRHGHYRFDWSHALLAWVLLPALDAHAKKPRSSGVPPLPTVETHQSCRADVQALASMPGRPGLVEAAHNGSDTMVLFTDAPHATSGREQLSVWLGGEEALPLTEIAAGRGAHITSHGSGFVLVVDRAEEPDSFHSDSRYRIETVSADGVLGEGPAAELPDGFKVAGAASSDGQVVVYGATVDRVASVYGWREGEPRVLWSERGSMIHDLVANDHQIMLCLATTRSEKTQYSTENRGHAEAVLLPTGSGEAVSFAVMADGTPSVSCDVPTCAGERCLVRACDETEDSLSFEGRQITLTSAFVASSGTIFDPLPWYDTLPARLGSRCWSRPASMGRWAGWEQHGRVLLRAMEPPLPGPDYLWQSDDQDWRMLLAESDLDGWQRTTSPWMRAARVEHIQKSGKLVTGGDVGAVVSDDDSVTLYGFVYRQYPQRDYLLYRVELRCD